MKTKIIFILALAVLSANVHSQTLTSLHKNMYEPVAVKGGNVAEFNIKIDFNNDGKKEIFKGIILKQVAENTYWVRNAQILNENNTVIVDFGKKIMVNGEAYTSQIPSLNGYIIEIPDNKNEVLVSMADEKGNQNSDEILINLDSMK